MKSKTHPASISTDHALNIPEIDEQHQAFFTLLNKIGTISTDMYRPLNDDAADALLDIMAEARDFAMDHFGTEESIMEEAEYPGLEEHQTAHERFIADMIRLESELMNGSAIPPIKIHHFMTEWWNGHLLDMDKPFGIFYKKIGK
ncbi:hemerythrin family protein [Pseudodesulfovibrio sp. S3-i]|uniref:bacteriohemerythrin n=1 Tax=Pseudodesulfovibrio sp. S3-i TaxID=2929474 RepID=UPI001FBBC8BD|nr:hemerythrin family protein [Pseudodesulfovibrio sp. S3-i]MCJ2166321.1 hemerythrin family protein [Pseudodesulfovibrio sp. S3-i]